MPHYVVEHENRCAVFSSVVDDFITRFMQKEKWVLWREKRYGIDPEINLIEIQMKKYNTETLECALMCVGMRHGIDQLMKFIEENNLNVDVKYYKEKIKNWEINEKGK